MPQSLQAGVSRFDRLDFGEGKWKAVRQGEQISDERTGHFDRARRRNSDEEKTSPAERTASQGNSKTLRDALKFRLCLWGAFRLYGADGTRLEITSKKGMALLAMLATASGGEKTRSWLQDRLWGTRQKEQAQQSLRREISSLKTILAENPAVLLADRERVRLDLDAFEIDTTEREEGGVFLEGIDLPAEDGFEDWLRERRQLEGPASEPRVELAPALPRSVIDLRDPTPGFAGKPAIAVMPFQNATRLDEGDIWADGMTEDLIERLARLRWLPVIAPASVAELRDHDLEATVVGQLVGAAYVLRGRLMQRSGALSLQLNLLDANNGQLLWSERIPLPDGITQEVLEDVLDRLVAMLELRIDSEEQLRVINRKVEDLNYNEIVWRARWHLNRLTRHDAAIARSLLATAIEERPNSADVLIQAAFAKAWDIWSGRREEDQIAEMRALALRAMASDGFDGRGYMLAGMAEMWLRNHALAESHFLEALRLNPSLARAHSQLGSNYYLSGRPQEAFKPLRTALRLSPLDNQVFYVLGEIAVSHCMLGEHSEAVRYADLSIARRPAYFYAHAIKINALARSDRLAAAKDALHRLYQVRPSFKPEDLDWLPFHDGKWNGFLKDGIALAGAS